MLERFNHQLRTWVFSQPVKFIFTGILNTLFGYAVFASLIWFGLRYPYALFFATCLGILFNFKSIGTLVFSNKNNRLLLRFIFLYIALYCINIALIGCLNAFYHNLYVNGMIAMLLVAFISFFCNKYFVFG